MGLVKTVCSSPPSRLQSFTNSQMSVSALNNLFMYFFYIPDPDEQINKYAHPACLRMFDNSKSHIHLQDKVLNLNARGNQWAHPFLSSKTVVDRRVTLFLFANDQFLMRAKRSFLFGNESKMNLSSTRCESGLFMHLRIEEQYMANFPLSWLLYVEKTELCCQITLSF